MNKQIERGVLHGTIQVPPSKSDAQRAILAAALAKGTSILYNCGESDDERSMIDVIQKLGAEVKEFENRIEIIGIDEFDKNSHINIGESGLGLRLITAICAAHGENHVISGTGTLLKRNQGFFENHLGQLGVKVESKNGFLPIRLSGQLKGGKLIVDGSVSSQFLSGLLMALPLLEDASELVVNNLKSIPYAQMTLDTLGEFGISINHQHFESFVIPGGQAYQFTKYAIESDWSSAGYWLVASALGHKIKCIGLNTMSHQADKSILDALVSANCVVTIDESGIAVEGNDRMPFQFDATHSPDLFPALVVLAAHSEGVSTIYGVSRLKNKESDRGQVLQQEFGKLGVLIELSDDQMHVHGAKKLTSATVFSHHDHRIAMSLAIAGIGIEGGIVIEDAECVSKSYPRFWNDLEELTIR